MSSSARLAASESWTFRAARRAASAMAAGTGSLLACQPRSCVLLRTLHGMQSHEMSHAHEPAGPSMHAHCPISAVDFVTTFMFAPGLENIARTLSDRLRATSVWPGIEVT